MDHLILPSLRRKLPWRGFAKIPGSASYTTPGTYSLVVPANFNTFVIDARGAGGGGGGAGCYYPPLGYGTDGSGGGASYVTIPGWASVLANPGGGGAQAAYAGSFQWNDGAGGAHGTAANGDSNITGGGAAGGGGGNQYGGYNPNPRSVGGNGGYGGRAVRTFTRQQLIVLPRQTLTIVVGGGGAAGANAPCSGSVYAVPQPGSTGAVYISWS
jgi:hypothetical protein